MTPLDKYQYDINHHGFQFDPQQHKAVQAFDDLYSRLTEFAQAPEAPVVKGWRGWFSKPQPVISPQGLYIWGGVGRGKTYLMDTFFDLYPSKRKMRMHFHRFMYRVHDELKQLQQQSDPLELVADKFKSEADVICFDEFFVSDITDAMLLGTLFEALFARNMILVATSNIPPHLLYRNGLQRARFLPAIKLIEQNCQVFELDSDNDFRMRTLQQAELYHYPLDDSAQHNLDAYFESLSAVNVENGKVETIVEVNHRQVDVIRAYNGVLMASFAQLCQTPRSQNDYIELSREYHTVLLSDMPKLDASNDDAARRFIALVDEFYERRVCLIIAAQVPLMELYAGGRLEFEFQRCESRLTEMQSSDYLAQEHLA
ncbi:ATPase [Vibrio sp. UCD-FRSSP16_10]|uniref:cell division protein ZapE n=1 Tax=unclassified Vibrio TaxID=2614977 RepID=UPI00080185AA|nr:MULTISPECIES: cell division protein ZapE [unclassified Vibrio]OBT07359.1 ATPase [Vibrio sp. UCD-FRSSP16_30]OBT12838.1 ATPase [Vibrio sp. UCD-FRSSP16_10]